MSNTDKLIQRFLMKLNSVEVREAFEILDAVLESLETKNDPDPVEMHIVNEALNTKEKLSLLESVLKQRVSKAGIHKGNVLQDLYDQNDSKNLFN